MSMWKRIRSHISPKDEKLEYLSPAGSRPPSTTDTASPPPLQRGRSSVSPNDQAVQENSRGPSPYSSFNLRTGREQVSIGDLGLHSLHEPQCKATADVIFVHGLGGASHKTWSKHQDANLFWPERWLPSEPGISNARIFTFGYNAMFRSGGPSNTRISDFAKDLLYEMKFYKDSNGQDHQLGKAPLIFVAHSMGGLVVKKAYLMGQNDERYRTMVQSISAIMFLATPHRGTNLADLLNRMLLVSFQNQKDFIVDLNKGSTALEDINEQFRHVAPKLCIFSFHETLPTSVGPKKFMILEKESSILGYPGEVSKSLSADHHGVCKYTSLEDPNYIIVRNALASILTDLDSKDTKALEDLVSQEASLLQQFLGSEQSQEEDLAFHRERWMPGTCGSILTEPAIESWLGDGSQSRVVWLTAPPATGKSVLSAYIIAHLQDLGKCCQYFFFRDGDHGRRSLITVLKSIGLQMARDVPDFRRALLECSRKGLTLDKKDCRFIWQKVFTMIFSSNALPETVYWVIDGLDESDSPKLIFEILSNLTTFSTRIQVLLVSRKTDSLVTAFNKLSKQLPCRFLERNSQSDNVADIERYIDQELQNMRGSEDLRLQVAQDILRRAEGNFLWVNLVLEEILDCHSQQAIEEALAGVPSGMTALYSRMANVITNNKRESDRVLGRTILAWAVCAPRPLTMAELSQALRPEFPEFLDFRRTIQEVCGQFVVINGISRVTLVHQTARDYLIRSKNTQLSFDVKSTQLALFIKSTSVLMRSDLRSKLALSQEKLSTTEAFSLYAATSFHHHLRRARLGGDDLIDKLLSFLRSQSVLTWIHLLAITRQLETTIKFARTLTYVCGQQRRLNAEKNPLLHRLQDVDYLEAWAVDLLKIVAKFSGHLLSSPAAIYKIIPSLCPDNSAMRRQFGNRGDSALSITGISDASWNDRLARVSMPHGAKAWRISCAVQYVAVLGSDGCITLWNPVSFEIICSLFHNEHVSEMAFDSKCDTFVSYGFKTTKIWAIPSGQLVSTVPKAGYGKALAIKFTDNDTIVIAGLDDKTVQRLSIPDTGSGWSVADPDLLKETSPVEGAFITSPSCMAFNSDASQIAVAYRGYPLSVWGTNEARLIGRCRRVKEHQIDLGRPSISWMAVDRVAWNPVNEYLVGIYKDGTVFKWSPVSDDNQESRTIADEIQVSPDGKLIITSDSNGDVKVWGFVDFHVLYQLSSENLVTGLAFSPDCSRFYDLRGSSVNAWEPNVLIRFLDDQDASSDTASESQASTSISRPSEALVETVDPITALAAAPNGSLYCVGYESGALDLFHLPKGKLLRLAEFSAFLSVEHLAWSADSRLTASSDLGRNVTVKELKTQTDETNLNSVNCITKFKVDEANASIQQILFGEDSVSLIVVTTDTIQKWSHEKGRLNLSRKFQDAGKRKWLSHPQQKSLLIGAGARDLLIVNLEDFAEVTICAFGGFQPQSHNPKADEEDARLELSLRQLSLQRRSEDDRTVRIEKTIITQDAAHLLVRHAKIQRIGGSKNDLRILQLSSVDQLLEENADAQAVEVIDIPRTLQIMIEVLLGILPGRRLVFLDKDLWMCSISLNSLSHPSTIERHFFIPRDWATEDSLRECCLLQDGIFLFPKDGEVAVIRSRIAEAGW